MKSIIFSVFMLSGVVNAQVGINTSEPKATLHVTSKVTSPAQPQGMILPYATTEEIDKWTGVEKGTIIYNTTENCAEHYNGTSWENHCGGRKIIIPQRIALPAGVSLGDGGYYIASIYDEDYLPYTHNVGVAAFGAHSPQGTKIISSYETIIDIPGKLDTNGVEVVIPVTAATGTNITLPSFSIRATIPAEKTQNNKKTDIELHFPGDTFTYGSNASERKYTIAKLRAVSNTLEVGKLDMNIGNGADYRGIQLVEFPYYKDNTHTLLSKFDFRVVTGVPDKNFSVAQGTESGTTYSGQYLHRFIYVPVYGLDGKVWLNNNLGANYANVDNPAFNPAKQAISFADKDAYGSLFQWGRVTANNIGLLGHELIDWASSTAGTPKISQLSWNADISASMTTHIEYCPEGFKTPAQSDWADYVTAVANTTRVVAQDKALRLSAAGLRVSNNGSSFSNQGTRAFYWSSTPDGSTNAKFMRVLSATANASPNNLRSVGKSIRCVKN